MLTGKQHNLLVFIDQRLRETGVSPSYDEMRRALDLKSKSGIHRLISGLEERGFIKRLPHRARALEILKRPEDMKDPARDSLGRSSPAGDSAAGVPSTGNSDISPGFAPNVIKGDFKMAGAVAAVECEAIEIPFHGRIAAGTPIEALRDTNTIGIPVSLLGRGEHYALEVDGDSMIEAGINDGDTVLIQVCNSAENGAIVVALIDDNEVTLKRLRRKGHSIALEPANKDFETRIFGPDQVQVQGRLVGLFRKY